MTMTDAQRKFHNMLEADLGATDKAVNKQYLSQAIEVMDTLKRMIKCGFSSRLECLVHFFIIIIFFYLYTDLLVSTNSTQ